TRFRTGCSRGRPATGAARRRAGPPDGSAVTYSVLSATAKLGIAAEPSTATYEVPAFTVPFTSGTRYRSAITQLYDTTIRARDTDIQDIQQGHYWSDWTLAAEAYPDWAGWLFRAMIGPDI